DYFGSFPLMEREQWFAREYVFNDVELYTDDPDGPGGEPGVEHNYSRMLGEIRDYGNKDALGAPIITRRVFFATPSQFENIEVPFVLDDFLAEPRLDIQPRFLEEQRVEYAVDSAGRLARADLLETGPNNMIVQVGHETVYDLVDVVRTYSFDGTITRVVRNLLGQTIRRYVGTDDSAWVFPNWETTGLALLERLEYGTGVNDAWLPTVARRYTSNPQWATDPFSELDPEEEDPDGFVTLTSYDWRMRPVRVDQFGETASGNRDKGVAPRLLTTLTYLDHAGKPAVVATFGAGTLQVPAALDPVLRREWQQPWRPAVSDLYALAIKPISVTELFYGPDGEIVERRAYHHDPNAPVGQQLSWHEEHACAGRGGITVYEQRPERPVTVSTLDGLGRRVSSTDLGWNGTAWARQLNRTDYLPDAEGNVCASARFERVIEDDNALVADSQFGAVNAVRTRSLAWFDPQKRLTASADLGSESRGAAGLGPDMLVAGPTAYERVVNDGNASEPYIHVPAQGDPEIRRVGLPDWARLSINRYSMLTGRLIWTAHPDGAITEFGYDKAGRLARRTENRFADTGVGEPSRRTDYEYTLGRLTGIVAYRVGAGVADGHKQVTRLVYGARVLAQEPTASPGNVPPLYVESGVHHASLIGRLHLPHPQTGGPTYLPPTPIPPTHEDPGLDTGEIVLRYNFQGQVAERIDARGVVFRYFYDGLERLSWIVVGCYDQGVFQAALPPSLASPSAPAARVMSVQYLYDAQGRLSDVIARASGTDPNSVISHNRYAYDTRGNVTTEWQGHQGLLGPTPPASTPRVDYTWSYRATDTPLGHVGHDRLDLIKYPAPPGSNEAGRRHVQFAYGDAGLLDDRLSRLRAVTSGVGGATEPIAAFDYAGLARRASLTLGTGSSAITAGLLAPGGPGEPIGLTGLDMFGALRDLHYRNTAGTTLFRAQLGHDVSGNRLFERVTQWPAPSLSTPGGHLADARSQLHGYDWFDRLTATSLGRLESDGSGIIPGTVLREDSWWLDLLGNWQPVPGAPPPTPETGRLTQGNLDGFQPAGAVAPVGGTSLSGTFVRWQDPGGPPDADPDDLHVAPDVDARNEVGAVVSRNSLAGSWTQETEVRHDAAGNVIFDGTYIYQYDAWNRLVQVNAGAIDVSLAPTPGEPYSDLRFGAMLKHYTHDGLGRLVRTRSPFPNPQTASPGQERSERFYYDGIRRIQETRLDPAPPLADAMPAKGSSSQPLEPGTPGELEGAPAGPPAESAPIPTAATTLVREYVWGPGDAWHPASVDELLVYYAEARKAWWPLHDASGDVAAVAAPGTSTENFRARVVAQQRYEAYGQVSSADHLLAHPFLSVGHKGLFYDRLDRGVSDSSATGAAVPPNGSVVETPRLVPFARGVYHLRNRTVIPGGGSPSLVGLSSIVPQGPPSNPTWVLSQKGLSSGAAVHGRFMQADPNSTALVLIRKAVFHGEPWPVERDQFDLGLRVTDGANLYAYLGSNPWNGSDPLGLWMWGDWSDTLAKGAEVFGLAVAVLDTYQFVMEEAVDWALDWDRPDDEINELSAIANAVGSDVDAEVDVVAGPYGPMIAGIGSSLKAAATIAKVLGKGKRLFYNWLCKGPKNVTVYMGKRNGRPYVGISNDIVRRGGEHGTKLKPLATGLTRNQARALENKIIKENPHFDNTIQSIADKHRFAQWADEFATELASKMGIRIKY
ncbi:MAG TPA: hypothetical protein VD963_00285, partial [Phycisphaerales bacterium]|nr:hypothetical protein [Phycisphaerales bacterium]